MKTHRNTASPFRALARMLFALSCFVLLMAQPALAQENNGRTAAQRASQGTPTPEAPGVSTDDPSRPCDFDDCSKSKVSNASGVDGVNIGVTGSNLSQLQSLRIQEGAPENSVFVAKDGAIGFGTKAPLGRLHVANNDAGDILVLDNNGNLEIGGLLTEASSRLLKENFAAVDAQGVLGRVVAMPITTWNYKSDDPAFRHMGRDAGRIGGPAAGTDRAVDRIEETGRQRRRWRGRGVVARAGHGPLSTRRTRPSQRLRGGAPVWLTAVRR